MNAEDWKGPLRRALHNRLNELRAEQRKKPLSLDEQAEEAVQEAVELVIGPEDQRLTPL